MTTPANELRSAAAKLRALATAASIGPKGEPTTNWAVQYRINEFTREEERDRGARLYATGDTAETRPRTPIFRGPSGGYGGRGAGPSMPPQFAEYIAAMDPTVGLALAFLLEAVTSNALENDHEECRSYCTPETCDVSAALAVARQINGSQP